MAIEFNISENTDVFEKKAITLTKSRIEGIYADRVNQTALVTVVFGVEEKGSFIEKKRELWFLSGSAYKQSLLMPPQGKSVGEVIDNTLLALLTMVQGDSRVKQQLIETGELSLSTGGIMDFIK